MNLGIVVYSDDAENVWNAFRLGSFAITQGDSVKTFLLAKGVECESLDTDKFAVTEQMQEYVYAGGEILACGTCLKTRNSEGSEMCPLSTMQDLYDLIKDKGGIHLTQVTTTCSILSHGNLPRARGRHRLSPKSAGI